MWILNEARQESKISGKNHCLAATSLSHRQDWYSFEILKVKATNYCQEKKGSIFRLHDANPSVGNITRMGCCLNSKVYLEGPNATKRSSTKSLASCALPSSSAAANPRCLGAV